MNIDNDEKIIKNALNTISTPEFNIKLKVNRRIEKQKTPIYCKRFKVGIIAACLSIILCLPVMASTSSSFRVFLATINSEFKELLRPIQTISEDNGIKMEVVAAMNDDEMAVAYITMQDLTGDRVDNTIDLYDYRLSKASMFTSEIVNYDKASKTATIRMQANGGDKLSGKELNFSVDSFLSGKKEINSKIDKNVFDNISNNNIKTMTLNMENTSGGSGSLFEEYRKMGNVNILKPNEINIDFPKVDFVHISNIGVIDGRLHIQTSWTEKEKDSHGYLYFTDKLGNKLNVNSSNISFGIDEKQNAIYGRNYVEYIFDIGNMNFHEINLNGYFVKNENYIKGKWKTKFRIEPINEEKQVDCNIKVGNGQINKISISPLGITLSGENLETESQPISIFVNMVNGTSETFQMTTSFSEKEKTILKFIAKTPLSSSEIKSVNINGKVINLK